jgi:ERCC4-related helicase
LTATPGSDVGTVQQVIDNLSISHIEIRTEQSPDTAPFLHSRKRVVLAVPVGPVIQSIQQEFVESVLREPLKRLVQAKAMFDIDPVRLHKFQLLQARASWRQRAAAVDPSQGRRSNCESDFALLITMFHAFDLLSRHGISAFHGQVESTIFFSMFLYSTQYSWSL